VLHTVVMHTIAYVNSINKNTHDDVHFKTPIQYCKHTTQFNKINLHQLTKKRVDKLILEGDTGKQVWLAAYRLLN